MGSYLHGIFDEDDFRKSFLKILCQKKGMSYENMAKVSFEEYREQQYNKLADILRESLDMKEIYRILEEGVQS